LEQNSFKLTLDKLRQNLADDRQKIAMETDELYRDIAVEIAPPPAHINLDTSDYVGTALKAERVLGQLSERLSNPDRKMRVGVGAALADACEAVSAEGRGATPRRLLQFYAHLGETSAHFENLSGAADVFETLLSCYNTGHRPLSLELLIHIATRSSIRSRNWLEPGQTDKWRQIVADRHVPCPVPQNTIERLHSRIMEISPDSGLIGAADALYIVLEVMNQARLDSLDLNLPTSTRHLQIEISDPQAAYWNRITRIMIPFLISHFCQGIFLPVITGEALTRHLPKIAELLAKKAPSLVARQFTVNILAASLTKLTDIDRQIDEKWSHADHLARQGRGTSLHKINIHLFQTGSICVADIIKDCNITPQAAHYQIKRLLKAGVVSPGPRGKLGGHYFLDVLLQM